MKEEMTRLNTKLVQFSPNLKFMSLSNNYITLSLLNVRLIVAKLECDVYYPRPCGQRVQYLVCVCVCLFVTTKLL